MKKIISILPAIGILIILGISYYNVKTDPDYKIVNVLKEAIAKGDLSTVRKIIEKDNKFLTFDNIPALDEAAFHCQAEIVDYLINKGADVNFKSGRHNSTALHVAACRCDNEKIIKLLIDQGAEINIGTDQSETPLMCAAENGNLAVIQVLIDKGANINAISGIYGTALDYAYEKKQIKAVKLLEKNGARRKRN